MAAINGGIDDVGKGGEIDELLRQLSMRVMEDRKTLMEAHGLSIGGTRPARPTEDPTSLDTTFEDAYDEEDEGEGWDGEENETEDEGSGLYRPAGSSVAASSSNSQSNGKERPMGFLGDSPPKSPAKVEAEAKAALGATSLISQLRRVIAGLERAADEALHQASIRSPIASPQRTSGFFSKKGEKKKVIMKLKEQLADTMHMRNALADQMARSASTAGVVLSMLQDKCNANNNETESQARELESAYEIVTRQEEDMNHMRAQFKEVKAQLERAERAVSSSSSSASSAPQPPTVIIHEKLVLSPSRACAPGSDEETRAMLDENDRLHARVGELETELDLLYGKLEALTHQHKTQQERLQSMTHKLQGEVGDVADELRHTHRELEARNHKYLHLKQHAARLEEELEATVGQVEAIKHQMELRTRKWDEQLWEAVKKSKEMEDRLKDELFNGLKMKEQVKKVQEEYDLLFGQYEAVKSQVELGQDEMVGLARKHDEEVEDMYARLGAKNEYADMLALIRKDTEEEMTDLRDRLTVAETAHQNLQVAFAELQAKHRDAAARRLDAFVSAQHKRMKRETLRMWKVAAR